MRIGDLRHRVRIQRPVAQEPNDLGEVVPVWQEDVYVQPSQTAESPSEIIVWAEVRDIVGREYWAAQQAQAEVTTRVRIRWRSGITPQMRVIHGERVLEIVAVLDPDGLRRELVLMCKEVR